MGKIRKKISETQVYYLKLWHELKGLKLFLFYSAHYTALFLILICFVFGDFREANKTLIWQNDGMATWFTNMVYLSQTVRNGIRSLLAGEGWTIPVYNFWLGTAPLAWGLDPIEWLAVLCPRDQIDVLYDVLVILRYYLVGLSFSLFGFYKEQGPLPILIGTFSYMFCGFSLYAGVRHPGFLSTMIFLPLLIIGTEMVLRKESPFLFLVMLFLSLISSLYFSCMIAIFLVLYVLVHFPILYTRNRGKEFGGVVCRFAVCGSVGIMLSGVIIVPSLLQALGSGRVGRDMTDYIGSWSKFGQTFYERFLVDFTLIPGDIGSWTCLGFSVLTIPAIILMFTSRRKEDKNLRLIFLILTGMILTPAVSYVMSGFNTLSNRWCFVYAFWISVILMIQIPRFNKVDKRIIISIVKWIVAYSIVSYYFVEQSQHSKKPIALLFAAMLLLVFALMLEKKGQKIMLPICLAITCFSICCSAFIMYDTKQKNYISEFRDKGEPYLLYETSQYGSFAKSLVYKTDDSFYRVAGNNVIMPTMTDSFYYGINGITSYSSYQYQKYVQWIQELELSRVSIMQMIFGLSSRSPMLSLASIKYYVLREFGKEIAPYGFTEIECIKNGGEKDFIMENQFVLPVGYTYDSYFPYNKYQKLSALARQEAQIQAVVLNELPVSSNILETSVTSTAQQIPVNVVGLDGVSWKEGMLQVTKENANLTLEFEGLSNTETYLRVVNLDLNSGTSTRRWTLSATTGETEASGYFIADAFVYSHGQKTQLLDLGYTQDGYTTCTLIFPSKGTFKLDDLEIWCQPMDNYSEQINALREEALENIETNWRGLTGTISVSKDKMLCIAIPYDKGWMAYVDGQRVKLYQANTAFMAVELSAGDHVVEVKYWPPGLTIGILLSISGLALVFLYYLATKIMRIKINIMER